MRSYTATTAGVREKSQHCLSAQLSYMVTGNHLQRRAVVYRKGELSKGMIDPDWPHQVALPAQRCIGRNYLNIHLFCEGLSLCTRGHSFRRNDIDMTVFCFSERAHAEHFLNRFGGEFIDPKLRPKWPGS
jgi:hypothetical protein